MAQQINVTYFGMQGTGRTITEARKDAGRKIESVLDGHYTPTVLEWRGNAILIWREPQGWCDRVIVCHDEKGIRGGKVWGCPNHDTEEEALMAANRHLAQLGWCQEDDLTPPPFLTNSEDVAEYRRQAEFQLRCCEARRRGLSDQDAYDYASRNPARPQVWAESA